MRINNNIPALAAFGALTKNDAANQLASMHLSTGYKINSAAEDAAGLAIANKLRNQLQGVNRASSNSSNGISIAQTADGALSQIQDAMQRMRELAVQATNDTNTADDRDKMQDEIIQLQQEINAMSNKCEYNKIKLLRGGKNDAVDASGQNVTNVVDSKGIDINTMLAPTTALTSAKLLQGADRSNDLLLTIQVGANKDVNMTLDLPRVDTDAMGAVNVGTDAQPIIYNLSTVDLRYPWPFNSEQAKTATYDPSNAAGNENGIDPQDASLFPQQGINGNPKLPPGDPNAIRDSSGSRLAIDIIDAALENISNIRARIGAYQNRLQYTVNNLDSASTNTSSSLSRVIDTDMAKDTTEFSKTNVMMQAGTAVLAQANQRPQMILQLIK